MDTMQRQVSLVDDPTTPPDIDAAIAMLLEPVRLWSAAEILDSFMPVPKSAGVYAWYFDEIPPGVPTNGCHKAADGKTLLYVGIAPRESRGRVTPSKRTLQHRLRDHVAGNAEGSTLRLTLGCMLAGAIGIQLRRVGSGNRYTFTNPGEIRLDGWLMAHAHVGFTAVEHPWEVESRLLSKLSLPLNLSGNSTHMFAADLGRIRAAARRQASDLPIVADSGGPRRVLRQTATFPEA
jgi:hypothetical protein